MSVPRGQRSNTEENNVAGANLQEVRLWDFCKSRFWRKLKLTILGLAALDIYLIYFKWRVVTGVFKRGKTSVVGIMAPPSFFAAFILTMLFAWYGIMKEKVLASKMFVVENMIQMVVADVLLLSDMFLVWVHGDIIPWHAGYNLSHENFDWLRNASRVTANTYYDFFCITCVTGWHIFLCVIGNTMEKAVTEKFEEFSRFLMDPIIKNRA